MHILEFFLFLQCGIMLMYIVLKEMSSFGTIDLYVHDASSTLFHTTFSDWKVFTFKCFWLPVYLVVCYIAFLTLIRADYFF